MTELADMRQLTLASASFDKHSKPGLFNALVLGWVSPKCNTLMQTAVG